MLIYIDVKDKKNRCRSRSAYNQIHINAYRKDPELIDEKLLKNEEKAIFSLRSLYKKYGYMPFKMSKFEEYDLYVRNKDFLVSDRIITFNDTNGKLLALKPDVTLSVIKSGVDAPGCKQKVYYNENIYRVSGSTHQYTEIMQAGLECIGDIDLYDVFEAVHLAAQSLAMIADEFVLEISHLGILSALLEEAGGSDSFRKAVAQCIAEKNEHDLARICEENGVSAEKTAKICSFIGLYGDMKSVIEKLDKICETKCGRAALSELCELQALIETTEYADKVFLDFSIVNDMNYYNGIVFKGFINGIYEGVLAGGRYDKLMEKMGRKSGAVGFAVYLDLLETLGTESSKYDVDVLLIYNEKTDVKVVADKVRELTEAGKSVSAQKTIPGKLRYRELINIEKEAR